MAVTITDLRELRDVESHLKFAIESPNETFNVQVNTLVEYIRERLNPTPTASIIMWPSETIPAGYVELVGQAFSVTTFPKLGAIFPSGLLPDTRGMTLKHAPDGRLVLSFEAEAVKSHRHTARFSNGKTNTTGSHRHTYGRIDGTSGSKNYDVTSGSSSHSKYTTNTSSAGSHYHTVTGTVAVSYYGSAKNLVDNIAVKFIVKAE